MCHAVIQVLFTKFFFTHLIIFYYFSDRVELWRLGHTNYTTGGLGTVLPLDQEPVKVVDIGVKHGEVVICSSVHNSGKWIAYSTTARIRLFKIDNVESNKPIITRVPVPDEDLAYHMAFFTVGNEDRFLLCPKEGGVSIFGLSDDGASRLYSASSNDLSLSGGIARACVGGNKCVFTDFSDASVCFDLEKNCLVCKIPGYNEAMISALGVSPDGKYCVMVYSNNKVMEVDLLAGRYTQFSKELSSRLPRSWLSRRTSINNVVFIHGNSDLYLLHDHSVLATVDKDKEMPEPSSKLCYIDPRSTPDTDSASVSSLGSQQTLGSRPDQATSGLRMSRKYDHLLSLNHLVGDEVVAVEIKPSILESQLPPSLKQKKFGGS